MRSAARASGSDADLPDRWRPLRRAARRGGGFTAAVVLSLGLGAGAAAAVAGLFRLATSWPPRLRPSVALPHVPWPDLGIQWRATAVGPAHTQGAALELLLRLALGLAAVATAVAAVNLGVLLTARAATRRHEMAVRAAVGAPRRRVVLQLLAEGAAVVGLALAAAIPVVAIGSRLLQATWPAALLRLEPARGIPLGALLIAAPVALTLALSLLPAAAAWRGTDLPGALAGGARVTAGRGELATRAALGALMVAATVALLSAAGVLVRGSTPLLGAAHSGFDPAGVSVARVHPKESGTALAARYEDALRRLRAQPGVEAAGIASAGAWLGLSPREEVMEECRCSIGAMAVPYRLATVRIQAVSPGYFDSLRVRLLRGRDFRLTDRAGAPRIAIIDRTFAEQWFDGDPIGRNIILPGPVDAPPYTVVGIVERTQARGLGTGAETTPVLFLSALQHPPDVADVTIRTAGGVRHVAIAGDAGIHPPGAAGDISPDTSGPAAALRAAFPGAPRAEPRPLTAALDEAAAPLRWFAIIVGVLAAVTGGVAAVGLFSVMAFDTARRERELGVRVALGATAPRIVWLVVRRSGRLAAVGAAIGVAAVYLATQLLRRLSADANALDPRTLGVLALVIAAIAITASVVPAARAARVDPAVALRE
ncbi:MAG TPA: FtsX-like permease family protein [Longimicrobiales bacterium]|nr:FtsX-like permease family protein [Longimicrobiales bacterium]